MDKFAFLMGLLVAVIIFWNTEHVPKLHPKHPNYDPALVESGEMRRAGSKEREIEVFGGNSK